MQKRNEATFADIPGVFVIAVDIIIAAPTEAEHDAVLLKVMERARQKNIKFNLSKLQFKVRSVQYMGNIVSEQGLKPCPDKIRAIEEMQRPKDRTMLMRFDCMVRYLAQFIKNESSLTKHFHELLKREAPWRWQPHHEQAFSAMKVALAKPVILQLYDPLKPVTVQTDASSFGIGSCLLQEGRPFAYASRSLTATEQIYSQIEKKMLAICFACAKFHCYIYGCEVHVMSDHRPLETIFKKP